MPRTQQQQQDMDSVQHRGPKGEPSQEMRAQLTETAVKGYMTDSLVASLTQVHPVPPAATGRFLITLCCRQGNFEYMIPEPVKTLDNWHLQFVDNCSLLKDIDFTSGVNVFPELMPPSSATPFLVTYFELQRRPFAVTVAHAPPRVEAGLNCIVIHAVSPRLPCTYKALEEQFGESSKRRKRAMLQHAMVSMTEGTGFENVNKNAVLAAAGGSAADSMDETMLSRLTLEHGDGLIDSPGIQAFELQGLVYSHTRESTAGSVVIPLVLRHLHFLRFVVGGPIMYHIKALSKYAYMVHMPNVGGWKVFVQVNMNANALSVRQWFSSPNVCTTAKHFITIALPPSPYPRCDATLTLRLINKCKGKTSPAAAAAGDLPADKEPGSVQTMEKMKPTKFISHIQRQGLEMLVSESAAKEERQRSEQIFADGQTVLRTLLFRKDQKALQYQLAVSCLFEALLGLIDHVWKENYKPEMDAKAVMKDVIAKFDCDAPGGTPPKLTVSDEQLKTILMACQDTPPSNWWIVVKATTRATHADEIVRAIFFNPHAFQALVPTATLFAPGSPATWEEMVKNAAATQAAIFIAKDHSKTIQTKAKFEDLVKKAKGTEEASFEAQEILTNTAVNGIAYMALTGDKAAFKKIDTT